jgi:hypothetical protein
MVDTLEASNIRLHRSATGRALLTMKNPSLHLKPPVMSPWVSFAVLHVTGPTLFWIGVHAVAESGEEGVGKF